MQPYFADEPRSVLCPARALLVSTDQPFVLWLLSLKGYNSLRTEYLMVIMHAYSNTVDELLAFVKCHSVHAVATSWATLCGVQLSEICEDSRIYMLNVCSVILTNIT